MHIHIDDVEDVEQCQTVFNGKAVDHIHEKDELAHFLLIIEENDYHIRQEAVQSLVANGVLSISNRGEYTAFGDMMIRLFRIIRIFYESCRDSKTTSSLIRFAHSFLQMGHLFCYRSTQSLRLVYLVFYALEADAMGAVLRGVHWTICIVAILYTVKTLDNSHTALSVALP